MSYTTLTQLEHRVEQLERENHLLRGDAKLTPEEEEQRDLDGLCKIHANRAARPSPIEVYVQQHQAAVIAREQTVLSAAGVSDDAPDSLKRTIVALVGPERQSAAVQQAFGRLATAIVGDKKAKAHSLKSIVERWPQFTPEQQEAFCVVACCYATKPQNC